MRRHAIGAIALVLLGTAAAFQIRPPSDAVTLDLQSACLRIGTVMAMIWLAYEHVLRIPRWLWWTLPILLAVLALRPRWLLIAVPLLVALAVLRPRWGSPRRSSGPPRSRP